MDLLDRIVRYLSDHDLMLATAESCTAGLIVSEIARVPGSGHCIDCGLAVYSPAAKHRYLGVSHASIENHGLTSEPVSGEMAVGALKNNNANLAVANTGIAGPSPGDDGTPVGTVCLAWAYRHEGQIYLFTQTRHFEGDRNHVRLAAAHYALECIPEYHDRVVNGDATPA
ncbi:MAG TPA: CinA family protein [Modicisalibacter sp.]|nr:CinA family protein [Modicisalibacter sp.]